MLAKSFPKFSLESRLSRESYNTKFGMAECAQNNYRVTLSNENGDAEDVWLKMYLYFIHESRNCLRVFNVYIGFKTSSSRRCKDRIHFQKEI